MPVEVNNTMKNRIEELRTDEQDYKRALSKLEVVSAFLEDDGEEHLRQQIQLAVLDIQVYVSDLECLLDDMQHNRISDET